MVDDSFETQAIQMRREYLRQWRSQNPERVRKYNKDYWIRKAERAAALAAYEEDENEHKDNQVSDR